MRESKGRDAGDPPDIREHRAGRQPRGRRRVLRGAAVVGWASRDPSDRGPGAGDAGRGGARPPGLARRHAARVGPGDRGEARHQHGHGRLPAGPLPGGDGGDGGHARPGLQPLRGPGHHAPGGAAGGGERSLRPDHRDARRARSVRARQPGQRHHRAGGSAHPAQRRRGVAGARGHVDARQPGQVLVRDRRERGGEPVGAAPGGAGILRPTTQPSPSSAARARTTSTTTCRPPPPAS